MEEESVKTSTVFFLLLVLAGVAVLIRYPQIRERIPWQRFLVTGLQAVL